MKNPPCLSRANILMDLYFFGEVVVKVGERSDRVITCLRRAYIEKLLNFSFRISRL